MLKLVLKHNPVFMLPIHPKRSDLYESTLAVMKMFSSAYAQLTLSIVVTIIQIALLIQFIINVTDADSFLLTLNDYYTYLQIVVFGAIVFLALTFLAIFMLIRNTEKRVLLFEAFETDQLISNYNPEVIDGKIEYKVANLINSTTNKEYPNFFVVIEWILFMLFIVSISLALYISNQIWREVLLLLNIFSIFLLVQSSIALKAYNNAIIGSKLKIAVSMLKQLGWQQDSTRIKWSAGWIYSTRALVPEWLLDSDDVMLKQFSDWLYKTPLGKQNMAVFQDEDKWPTPYWLHRNISKSVNVFSLRLSYFILFIIYAQLAFAFISTYLSTTISSANMTIFIYPPEVWFFIAGFIGFSIAGIYSFIAIKHIAKSIDVVFRNLYRESEDGLGFLNEYFFALKSHHKLLPQIFVREIFKPALQVSVTCIILAVISFTLFDLTGVEIFGVNLDSFSSLALSLVFGFVMFSSVYCGFMLISYMLLRSLERYYSAVSALKILNVLGWDEAEYRISTPRKFR